MRWAQGPVHFAVQRCLPVGDIPNDRIMKFHETDDSSSVFRQLANYAIGNGNGRVRQGRLLTCEHPFTRRVTRNEHNGETWRHWSTGA